MKTKRQPTTKKKPTPKDLPTITQTPVTVRVDSPQLQPEVISGVRAAEACRKEIRELRDSMEVRFSELRQENTVALNNVANQIKHLCFQAEHISAIYHQLDGFRKLYNSLEEPGPYTKATFWQRWKRAFGYGKSEQP